MVLLGPVFFRALSWCLWAYFWGMAPSSLGNTPSDGYRIGVFLWHESPNDFAALEGIKEGLRAFGKPHEIDVRQAHSNDAEAEGILESFESSHLDLVFALGTEAALLAKKKITNAPVVFTAVTHPVESLVVPDWSGSQSNLAGNSNWIGSDTVLRVFKLAVPHLKTLGILRSEQSGLVSAAELRGMRSMLSEQGKSAIILIEEVADGEGDIVRATKSLLASGVDAIWIPIDITIYENIEIITDCVQSQGIPLVSSSLKGARAGAVAGILVDYVMLGKRAVVIALDILEKRETPGRIPIGVMHGYQVVVNLKASNRLGYELPLSLLAVADLIFDDDEKDRE